ncbi:hypothetical protein DF268_24245 [Streptomyces sp. V2]|nr:hypothetical protein DF268_24245 [Streptomyces sp. V2]
MRCWVGWGVGGLPPGRKGGRAEGRKGGRAEGRRRRGGGGRRRGGKGWRRRRGVRGGEGRPWTGLVLKCRTGWRGLGWGVRCWLRVLPSAGGG